MKQYLNILQAKSIKEYFSVIEEAFEEIVTSDHKIREDYIGTIILEINDNNEITLSIENKKIFIDKALDYNKKIEIAVKKLKIKELQKYRYKGNIHGHMHSKIIDDPFYINCSIEQLPGFKPIEFVKLIADHNKK